MTQTQQDIREKAVDYIEKLREAVAKRKREMDVQYQLKPKQERRNRPTSYSIDYNPTEDILSVLDKKPGLSIREIANELGVPTTKLKHWIKKLLASETIKKLAYQSQARTIRYYLASHNTSGIETRDPNTATNIVLTALKSGPKPLKYLRKLVNQETGTDEKNTASNSLVHLMKIGKVERIKEATYQLKGEPTK